MARQRVRPEVAGPMTSSGGAAGNRRLRGSILAFNESDTDYRIVRRRG
jgi:hypothetical protein